MLPSCLAAVQPTAGSLVVNAQHRPLPDATPAAALAALAGWAVDTPDDGVATGFLGPLTVTFPEALTAFQRAYPEISAVCEPTDSAQVMLRFSTVLPVRQLRAALQALCQLQAAVVPGETLTPAEAVAQAAAFVGAQAPYYLRYLFVREALQDPAAFAAARPVLEQGGFSLNPGHSQSHRYQALEPYFPGGQHFVDIGCGKAYYLRRLAERYAAATGFEADAATRARAQALLRHHRLGRVRLCGAFDAAQRIPAGAHVLMTEVLEHIPHATAVQVLRRLATQPAQRLVFTAPNRDFNGHYGVAPGAFRHWDHRWEPDFEEFAALMLDCFSRDWRLEICGIGDAVDGVHASSLCCATRVTPTQPGSWGPALKGLLR